MFRRIPQLFPAKSLPPPTTRVTVLPNQLRVATEETYGQVRCTPHPFHLVLSAARTALWHTSCLPGSGQPLPLEPSQWAPHPREL